MSRSIGDLLDHPEFKEGVYWTRRHWAAKEVVFAEGDKGVDIYLILSGKVRVMGEVDIDAARKIQPGFSDLKAGEVFGELSLFDHGPRSATVVAVEDCELAVIDGRQLMAFLDHHPETANILYKNIILLLIERLRATDRRMFSLFAWGLRQHGIDRHL